MAPDSSTISTSPNHNDVESGSSLLPSHPLPHVPNVIEPRNIPEDPNIQTKNNNNNNEEGDDPEFFKKMRGWLMIVAILAAGSTYQAGLNPPGGFWQDDKDLVHVAGNPVMHDKYFRRYQAFFYCNAISFLSSLVIIILLINKNFFCDGKKIRVLKITMVLDLFSFMGAYAAGSSRRVSSSFYLIILMGVIFLYVFLMFLMASYSHMCTCVRTPPAEAELTRSVPMEPTRSENIV